MGSQMEVLPSESDTTPADQSKLYSHFLLRGNAGHRDSGYEDSGTETNPSNSPSPSPPVLRSILRAKPQVFQVKDKKDRKNKVILLTDTLPRKVHFYFPEGVVVPERVSTEHVGFLKLLQQKIFGVSFVPWRPSVHSMPKGREIDPLVLSVDEKSQSGYLQNASSSVSELRRKSLEETEFNEEEPLSFKERDDEENYGDESQADYEFSDYENSKSDNEEGCDDDEDGKVSRRRALRQHFKRIDMPSNHPTTMKKIRMIAEVRGRHRRRYPRERTNVNEDEPAKQSASDSQNKSSVPDLDSQNNDSRSSSRQGSLEDSVTVKISHILDQYTQKSTLTPPPGFVPTPTQPGTPGRIIRARYRRFPETVEFPRIE